MDSLVTISSDTLTAAINPFGAELSSLRDAQGRELLTDGDPAWWAGRSPLLFPIIGELAGGQYRVNGGSYALPRHGFARRLPFETISQQPGRAMFRLVDGMDTTHALYPFRFSLDMDYRLDEATLIMAATLTNSGDEDLPASFGFHPGFAWPLPYGAPREAHRIVFGTEETSALRGLKDGLIAPPDRPSPVEGRLLPLADEMFEDDALIWEGVASNSLIYGAEGAPGLEISWENMPNLGIWTKAGAPFLCVEPWAGIADRHGFSGDIWDKPGIVRLAPAASQSWSMRITLQGT